MVGRQNADIADVLHLTDVASCHGNYFLAIHAGAH